MILNVSGRTDIVAFYTRWFMNRYKEGYVMVRNPFNYHLVNEIYFEDVDLIVFCTKNPLPIIDRIKEIDKSPPKFPARNMDVGPSAPPIMQTVVCSFIFITLPRISNKNPIQQPTRPNTFFTV